MECGRQNIEVWGGMECTINRVGDKYFDQLNYSNHRERESDIKMFADLGLKKMRYPILWEHHKPTQHIAINWSETEAKLNALRENNVDVIAGLVHHGSGPAYVDIKDTSFVSGLTNYADEVAKKFPWINYYTPVNEPLTTARFCGLYGLWYPHKSDDACFCRILVNECKATVLAMNAIRVYNPNAKLVQTDDLGKVHSTKKLAYQAAFENERRWLSFDLLCGKVDSYHPLRAYMVDNEITVEELDFFVKNPCPPDILGINYYLTSERYIDQSKRQYPAHTHGSNGKHTYADVEVVRVGAARPDGLQKILSDAWQRYGIPIAVTEVHLHCTREEQMRWLKYIWDAACTLKDNGVPVLAITPWALLGSVGWDKLLTNIGGTYEPGVFDLSAGYPRPTILAEMIRTYSKGQSFTHPALDTAGWWERDCRVVYGCNDNTQNLTGGGRALFISGIYTAELADLCTKRGLNYKLKPDGSVWAHVAANEYLEFQVTGKIDLIISLSGVDLIRTMNAAFDLFIDGETGYWTLADDGILHKKVLDIKPLRHYLAS